MRLGHHVNGPEDSTNGDGMCRKVDICVDSFIFVLFSYSIRFILVRSCEILGRTEQCSYFFFTFKKDVVYLNFKTKKNGREFLSYYIRPHSAVDSAQWDWGIRAGNSNIHQNKQRFLKTMKIKLSHTYVLNQ